MGVDVLCTNSFVTHHSIHANNDAKSNRQGQIVFITEAVEGILAWTVEEEKKTKEQQYFLEREYFLSDKRNVNNDKYHFDSKPEGLHPNKQ
eukprot:11409930-Ditylum_brightwellii.AAC.1